MATSSAARYAEKDQSEWVRVPSGGHTRLIPNRQLLLGVLLSTVLLLPCFWHSRIQAGDLSSHAYNAWLTSLVEDRGVQGVAIVSQWTNALFDHALLASLRWVGADAAQKLTVSMAVLIFFWGAFAFVSSVAGRRLWAATPILAVFTYGWVFHMGFFNFYCSLGLCLFALALLWKPKLPSLLVTPPLVALAFFAHALPVAWAVGVYICATLLRRLQRRIRLAVTLGSLTLVAGLRPIIARHFPVLFQSPWSGERIIRMSGVDQAWVYGPEYIIVAVGILLVWLLCLHRLLDRTSLLRLAQGVPFQLWLLHAFGVLLIPVAIMPPGSRTPLEFLPERMSLTVALPLAAFLFRSDPGRIVKGLSIVICALFFALLWRDTGRFNAIEDRVTALVTPVPPGQRVIGPLCLSGSRINALLHTVDRACIGHCFSYANYEPSTFQFRVRAIKPNAVVMADAIAVKTVERGTYRARVSDLPLYVLNPATEAPGLESLQAGEVATTSCTDSSGWARRFIPSLRGKR